jgi:D-inositol-3-phosphate glycosyltransferase
MSVTHSFKERLSICLLSIHSSPLGQLGAGDTGGMSVYIREIATELGKLGHQVDIFTRKTRINNQVIHAPSENVRLIHLEAGSGAELHRVALFPHIPEFAANLDAFRRGEGAGYDLIFSHYWLSGCVGELAAKWWRVPHMLMFHTLAAVKNTIGEQEPPLRLETETRLARNTPCIIAATERDKENIVGYYGAPRERVLVIPCGVNLALFRPLDRKASRATLEIKDEKVVLFVGRLERLKGLTRLLPAFARLPEPGGRRLLVVGGDSNHDREVTRLKAIADRLGIGARVTFIGPMVQSLLPLYYNAADVTVVPSYYESFGLVPLESLACGTPVLATDVGDLKNIIRPGVTGDIIATRISDITDKIDKFLSREFAEDQREVIRNSVALYDWRRIAPQLEAVCRRVVLKYGMLTH